ncbi:MAG TPA: phenylacetate--CoA ligase family protein [Pirellulales bacterium]|nr:phenylacetate--CoA ligase family protein [Pirellulales bacterium]
MSSTSYEQRRRFESMDAADLEEHQLLRLNQLLARILPDNSFYAEALAEVQRPLTSLDDLAQLPFTFKEDLVGGVAPGGAASGELARHLTYPASSYVRFHQTSGTRGRPMVVLDTAEDWQWWLDCWQYVLDSAELTERDCVFMAFSFGPFIGFWSAFEAAAARGALMVPGGGLGTLPRLELMRTSGASTVFCTPSYALHMAEAAAARNFSVADLPVRTLVLAGEAGGSIPAVRARIEEAWQAQVIDHAGATEVGPWGYSDRQRRGVHVLESEFIAEFLSLESGQPAAEGELSELVLTNLGRFGSPVIRYRTGDLVRPVWQHDMENRFVLLEGGVVGRNDDMLTVRGVNIFPTAIEQIVRSFPEVLEYQAIVTKVDSSDQIILNVEDRLATPVRIAEELHLRLGLKVEVRCVALGSLPRFEGKGSRLVDQR